MAKKSNKPKEEPKASEEKSEEAVEETQGAKDLPGVPNDITEEEAKKADEEAVPKFKNNGKDIKINLGTRDESKWITVKAEEVVTIPRKIALANGLEEVK